MLGTSLSLAAVLNVRYVALGLSRRAASHFSETEHRMQGCTLMLGILQECPCIAALLGLE
jgi:hypothetical protein